MYRNIKLIFFPEGDNYMYTVMYLHEVPVQGMCMFTGEGVCILVFLLSPDLTPPEESQSQFGEPVPPINFVQDIVCTHHNMPHEVLIASVKAFGSLVMSGSISTQCLRIIM